MTPEPMRPHWPDALRFTMLRVPAERLLPVDQRLAGAAGRPVIYPETPVSDHGKPYQSEVVLRACRRLGISIQDARKIHTHRQAPGGVGLRHHRQFCEHLAGCTGSGVEHRGRHTDDTARWSIDEIAELFAEYVVAVYQRRHHRGLVLQGFPT
jgi:putative transposase